MTPSPLIETLNFTDMTESLFFFDATKTQNGGGTEQAPIFDKTQVPVVGEGSDEPDEIVLVPSLTTHRMGSTTNLKSPTEGTFLSEDVPHPTVTMETLNLSFNKAANEVNKSLLSFSVPKTNRSIRVPLRARKEAKRSKRKGDAWANDLGGVFGFKDGPEGLRRGDSDLDVGSESGQEAISSDDGGMEVDGDLDPIAMANFALKVNQQHMSAHDIEIEEAIKRGGISSEDEDEDENEDTSEEEDETEDEESKEALEMLEAIIMEEGDEENDEDWSSDDEDVDVSSNTRFTRRLQKARERTPGYADSDQNNGRSKADNDEDYIAEIQV